MRAHTHTYMRTLTLSRAGPSLLAIVPYMAIQLTLFEAGKVAGCGVERAEGCRI